MRIGILTFHSQLNYGGVLQAWALREALEGLGHDALVVDRWLSADNAALLGPFARKPVAVMAKECALLAARGLFGCGTVGNLVRHVRTARFVRGRLRLTPWHFVAWREVAGQALGLDRLVVGSDQVWHCGDWGNPRPYLLEGAPEGLRAIAYAASFGITEIPAEWREAFRVGLQRFSAIGVREAEGVGLAASVGAAATHVLDPTQLVPAARWREGLGLRARGGRPRLVCYFLSQDVRSAWPLLEAFARRMGARVDVFLNGPMPVTFRPAPLLRQLGARLRASRSPVRLRFAAGPREFVEAFANARWVLSDSFHALMFASIFGRNARILRPATETRRRMFARIDGFAARYVAGPLTVGDVAEALAGFEAGAAIGYDTAALEAARAQSRDWLRAALG